MQAGVEQANLAAQNERSAALNNAITQQQLQQRPEMLNMASNLLAQRDAQALAEMQYGQGLNLQATQMANQQALAERQQRMQEEAISRANRQQEMESIGQLMAFLSPELQRLKTRGKKPSTATPIPDIQPGIPLTVEEAPVETMDMPMPSDSALGVQDVLRGVFGMAQPENLGGGLTQVTDIKTIEEINNDPNRRISRDLGNGLAMVAYLDPRTGRYMKMYARSNPQYVGAPVSGEAVLRQGETGVPSAPVGFARAFYG